ncbi:hypothetical protein [Sphingomonas sp. DBB INV C78]|uniref:hypothetical protein n=1 Tax=Sphingomonas sp. DBB INV C78 TaxID=3349434 RepID=UPI0036D32D66
MSKTVWRMMAATAAVCALAPGAAGQGAQAGQATPTATTTAPNGKTIDARAWPRSYAVDGVEFSIYRPQLDSWTGNVLQGRSVMAVKTGETKGTDGKPIVQQTYGVLWLTARTETDKDAREVVLDDLTVQRINFPTAKDKEATYLAIAKKVMPTTELVASLDAIEAQLAITDALSDTPSVAVNNTPPEIIISLQPAALVPIDGEPVWRPTAVSGVEHVLNSTAMILRYQNKVYIGRAGRWATAASLNDTWARATSVPKPVTDALNKLLAGRAAPQGGMAEPEATKFAAIYVRTKPAELIVIDGDPQFDDIEGTGLSYVTNTPADIFLDQSNNWYALVSGRWFKAQSTKGPWTYVAPDKLPAGFQKIPSDGPKGAVLASIAGTPEAKESLVANSVPQTATVNKKEASFNAQYDGAPQFAAIEGTALSSARNSPTAIIKISANSYMALDRGVWFTSTTATGPWAVATEVPAVIYTIPASSPIHYVTYVRIYGSKGDEVYVGYTPGYYGTAVNNGVVVYGTGYTCQAWTGSEYYSCPSTYGYGASLEYSEVGWSVAYGYGWYDPWYYPYWGPWYYPGYYPGYWGGYAYGYGNVYGRWGSSVIAGSGAAWANAWTGNYGRGYRGGYHNMATGGRGYGYAGWNSNVYTGNSVAAAGGIRYNPQTGRVVAGRGGAAGNIYTGNAVAGGSRTAVNTDTGRVTKSAGAIGRTDQGAGAAGGFNTTGQGGDAKGAGYVHYDRNTGDISKGGVVDVNGNVYAGKDGNVYRYDKESGSWESMGQRPSGEGEPKSGPPKPDSTGDRGDRASRGDSAVGRDGPRTSDSASNRGGGDSVVGRDGPRAPESSLNKERAARDRGFERDSMSGRGFENPGASRPSYDRGSWGGGYSGRMGGFRGGGFRGGGRRF